MTTKTYPRAEGADRILAEAGPTMSVVEAGHCLGIGRDTAYRLARTGEFPVKVLSIGRQYRIPTAEIRRALGLDQAGAA